MIEMQPDAHVFVAGILANSTRPAEFIYDNARGAGKGAAA